TRGVIWPENTLVLIASTKLVGTVATWFSSALPTIPAEQQTWSNLKNMLRPIRETRHDGRSCGPAIPAKEVASRDVHRVCHGAEGVRVEETTMITAFTNGIDEWTRGLVRVSNPRTLTAAAKQAIRLRGNGRPRGRGLDGQHGKIYLGKRGRDGGDDHDDKYGPSGEDQDDRQRRRSLECWICHEIGHISRYCPKKNDKLGSPAGNGAGILHPEPKEEPGEKETPGERARICRLSADGLPTATMFVDDGEVEEDRYLREYGQRLPSAPPAQAVEGLGGTTLRVDDVWRFKMATAYDQHITVEVYHLNG
ncbi:TPA: hypothetical protein N0F65_009240, partial [Lagenidium giganteum]